MVVCTIPIRLYGEHAGFYRRGGTDPRDELAALYPENFKLEQAGPACPAAAREANPTPDGEETEKTNKRRKP